MEKEDKKVKFENRVIMPRKNGFVVFFGLFFEKIFAFEKALNTFDSFINLNQKLISIFIFVFILNLCFLKFYFPFSFPLILLTCFLLVVLLYKLKEFFCLKKDFSENGIF